MAPEYVMRGHLTSKADVYGFGVLVLEVFSGRSNVDYRPNDETVFLLDLAYVLQKKCKLLDLIDPDLNMMGYPMETALALLNLAMLCTDPSPTPRPNMSEVVGILEGKANMKSIQLPARYMHDFQKVNVLADTFISMHSNSYSSRDRTTNPLYTSGKGTTEKLDKPVQDPLQLYDISDEGADVLKEKEGEKEEGEREDVQDEFDGGNNSVSRVNDQSISEAAEGGGNINDVKLLIEDSEAAEGGGNISDAKLLIEENASITKESPESSNAGKSSTNGVLYMDYASTKMDDAKLLMERKFPVMAGPSESSNARKSWSSTTALFTDHNVTKMNEEEDKGELEYIEPTFDEDGKLHIEYSEKEFEEGCNEWKDSLVGFCVGDDKPVIMNTILNKENVETLWGVKGDDAVFVFSMEGDYFLIRFKYVEDKIKVLESGPWHIENRPLILREWNWKLKFDKINEMKITLPIWVKMYNLPLFLWTSSYLSKVGSALGTPLYSDEKTKNKERVDFARLCIQVDASKSLPNSLNISIKDVNYEIRFEYEWKPLRAKVEGTKQN